MKVRNGEKNFDLFGARKTFDAYKPGQSAMDLSVGEPEAEEETLEGEVAEEKVAEEKAPATRAPAKSPPKAPQEDPRGLFSDE